MQKQRGITFIGLVAIIAAGLFVVTIGMKLIPPYLEFMAVKKAIANIAAQPGFQEMNKKDISDMFGKSASINDIRSINAKELVVSQGTRGPVVTAEYQVIVPLMGNLSALIEFHAATDE